MTDSGFTSLRSVPTAQDDAMATLAQRLEAAEVGSRELDAAVAVALRLDCRRGLPDDLEYLREVRRDDQCAAGTYWFVCRSGMSLRTASSVTTSLDAALALAGRLGWPFWSGGQGTQNAWAHLYDRHPDQDGPTHNAKAATPALALCAAILRAKDSSQ